ncbi:MULTISPECIES: acyl-CoA dehydrogenase family protein [Rhodococcus]|uniref:Acyl-CoA dehydrogenase family protein n=1 Tax=Rhodococcus oxybenzonivorans TaxID=1990687 RepID=A0AAE4V1M4_9NOCA|nr:MULTISPECIES: acyl-CoA dehydrogenase family protein [Rhodococcus]MDV7245253.1 acyl-CoA dehydrogenase family protein [Rhodococcus oxybenzonivorans]MDV7267028.1 acyl-CoA dehydrogenase family protein [Rhodococcus oxybenzonivorans]MDV7272467.1 acyl-CoA dehydrogenase family protein [Rhodococcus oxybenzonivorans]MDV7336278.1 acyl-CoA dehydrogenase family protein [Rhodococcus oxybenzonivorans]MDV7342963.1 acyl-CoA dehydrogenase family protein [Rhodococcus oxybenzonivorans]
MSRDRLVPRVVDDPSEFGPLRDQVRAFVRECIDAGDFTPGVDTWLTEWNPEFSRRLAARGWIGMTIPTEYGGHGRSHIERFIVTEELLAAGAPVAAHWIADRQIAPSLLKFGTEKQKRQYLPAITNGECFFGIGMSEPDSGSDLASVRTKATRVDGGWTITGTKVWTSGAHHADAFFVLARTAPRDPAARHAGLSQFIVDLRSPGITVRPIVSMTGSHHFNEVVLEEVFVRDESVLGRVGDGWQQVTSELAYERSGPERFLSTFPLLAETAEQAAADRFPADGGFGRLIARIAGLHHMSSAVAGALHRGERADSAAAAVKLLGTVTEGDIADYADLHMNRDGPAQEEGPFGSLIDHAILQRPGFTLRGGTTEILEGVVARELGLR